MNLYDLKQILAQSKHPKAPSLYAEVCNHIDHFVNNDGDPENVRLVDPFALFLLLNETCYDICGKLLRADDESLDHFVEQARFYLSPCLTDEQLKDVYDAMYDLWHDNERDGYNLADGGFLSTHCSLIRQLHSLLLEHSADKDHLGELLQALLTRYEYEELKTIITQEDNTNAQH